MNDFAKGLEMKKCFLFVICALLPFILFATEAEIVEQGSSNYYFSATGNSKYLKDFIDIMKS